MYVGTCIFIDYHLKTVVHQKSNKKEARSVGMNIKKTTFVIIFIVK